MKQLIAYCGLDCEKCEAYIATQNNDNELRAKVAKNWSEMNHVEITPEMINCDGCRADGRKTPFCDFMCEIKKCASGKKVETCKNCTDCKTCQTLKMIVDNSDEAKANLGL